MLMEKIIKGNLKIDSKFFNFINNEVIPGTGINSNNFWSNFDKPLIEFKLLLRLVVLS